jgi:O-antigen/teichoic acid export membrane protein
MIRKIVTVMSGTLGAQIITISASPLITRLYSPVSLGGFGLFNSTASILIPIFMLSLPMALVLPKTEDDAARIRTLCLMSGTICTFVASVIIFLVNIDGTFEIIKKSSILVSLTIFSLCLTELLNYSLLRWGFYKISAKAVFFTSVFVNFFKVSFSFFTSEYTSLITSVLFSNILVSVITLFIVSSDSKFKFRWFNFKSLYKTFYEYIDFPKFKMPQGILSAINQSVPVFLIGYFFNLEATGYYVLCRSVVFLPVNIVGKAIVDVLFPEFSNKTKLGEALYKDLMKVTISLSIIGLFPVTILTLYGEEIFTLVFGVEWSTSGIYAQTLAIWTYFNFINKGCVATISVLRMNEKLLLISVLNFFISLGGFYLGYTYFGTDIATIQTFSILSIIPQIILMHSVFKETKK